MRRWGAQGGRAAGHGSIRKRVALLVVPAILLALRSPTPALARPLPSQPPDCAVVVRSGPVPAAGEADRAREACRHARERFAALFGEAPPVRIELWHHAGYRTGVDGGTAVVFWPVEATPGPWADDPAMLPHEIGHVLLAARFPEAEPPEPEAGRYGTGLPDWLEEAVAIWLEPAATREARLARARALPAARLDLRAILTTPHPAAARPAILALRDGAAPPADDEALWDFYPQAVAALAFVVETGGRAAVRKLVRTAAGAAAEATESAPPADAALGDLTGLGGDDAAILRAWRAWLGAR